MAIATGTLAAIGAIIAAVGAVGGAATAGVQQAHAKKTADNAAAGQAAEQERLLKEAEQQKKNEEIVKQREKDKAKYTDTSGGRSGTLFAGPTGGRDATIGVPVAGKTTIGL